MDLDITLEDARKCIMVQWNLNPVKKEVREHEDGGVPFSLEKLLDTLENGPKEKKGKGKATVKVKEEVAEKEEESEDEEMFCFLTSIHISNMHKLKKNRRSVRDSTKSQRKKKKEKHNKKISPSLMRTKMNSTSDAFSPPPNSTKAKKNKKISGKKRSHGDMKNEKVKGGTKEEIPSSAQPGPSKKAKKSKHKKGKKRT